MRPLLLSRPLQASPLRLPNHPRYILSPQRMVRINLMLVLLTPRLQRPLISSSQSPVEPLDSICSLFSSLSAPAPKPAPKPSINSSDSRPLISTVSQLLLFFHLQTRVGFKRCRLECLQTRRGGHDVCLLCWLCREVRYATILSFRSYSQE